MHITLIIEIILQIIVLIAAALIVIGIGYYRNPNWIMIGSGTGIIITIIMLASITVIFKIQIF